MLLDTDAVDVPWLAHVQRVLVLSEAPPNSSSRLPAVPGAASVPKYAVGLATLAGRLVGSAAPSTYSSAFGLDTPPLSSTVQVKMMLNPFVVGAPAMLVSAAEMFADGNTSN